MNYITSDDVLPLLDKVDIEQANLDSIVAQAQELILNTLRERNHLFTMLYQKDYYDFIASGTVTADDVSNEDIFIMVMDEDGDITEIVNPDTNGNFEVHLFRDTYYYIYYFAPGYEVTRIAAYNTADLGSIILKFSPVVKNAMIFLAAAWAAYGSGFKAAIKAGALATSPPEVKPFLDRALKSLNEYFKSSLIYFKVA